MLPKLPKVLQKLPALALACVLLCTGFKPNPDTAKGRQDRTLGTAGVETQRQDRVIEARPLPMVEPRYAPDVQLPYAYPDVNLDGQEFFPRKPQPGQHPQVYKPGDVHQPPNVYVPDAGDMPKNPAAPFIYRPESR